MYKIDSDIPVPESRTKYPFADMEVDDSILFKDEKKANSARVAALRFGKAKSPKWVFTVRRVHDGWRLWRTA